MKFPIWKHHKVHGEKLIHNQEQYDSLGEGWGDDVSVWLKPSLVDDKEEIAEPVIESKQGRKPNASKKISV